MFRPEFSHMDKLIDQVTSRHHQACSSRNEDGSGKLNIPENLVVIAHSGDKKKNEYNPDVVEIFKHKTYPLYCVQYHPENHDSSDELTSIFINELLNFNTKSLKAEK